MADTDGAGERAFHVDLANAIPSRDGASTPHDVAARRAVQARLSRVIPHNFSEEEALRFALASAMRNPHAAVGVLFGFRFLRDIEGVSNISQLGLTADEYGALLAALPPHTPTAPFDALERQGGVHLDVAKALANACHTTMLSEAIQVAWCRSVVRAAAVVALRSEDSVPMLAAVIGESSRSDARRVDDLLSDLYDAEDGADEHLQPMSDAILALAAALSNHS